MAIVLGSCGCGCGDPCSVIKEKCNNFVIRQYAYDNAVYTYQPGYEDCASSPDTCLPPDTRLDVSFDVCSGEGETWILNPAYPDESVRESLLSTFIVTPTDYVLDLDKIEKYDFEGAREDTCYFKYDLGITPDPNSFYYFLSLPCDSAIYYREVQFDPLDGKAYLQLRYDEGLDKCI